MNYEGQTMGEERNQESDRLSSEEITEKMWKFGLTFVFEDLQRVGHTSDRLAAQIRERDGFVARALDETHNVRGTFREFAENMFCDTQCAEWMYDQIVQPLHSFSSELVKIDSEGDDSRSKVANCLYVSMSTVNPLSDSSVGGSSNLNSKENTSLPESSPPRLLNGRMHSSNLA